MRIWGGSLENLRVQQRLWKAQTAQEQRAYEAAVPAARATLSRKTAALVETTQAEVLRLRVRQDGGHETDYKCWCASEGSKQELVARIYALQHELEHQLNRGGGVPDSP